MMSEAEMENPSENRQLFHSVRSLAKERDQHSAKIYYLVEFVRLVTEHDIFSWFLNTGTTQVENTENLFK
jgi:hypothetical protein